MGNDNHMQILTFFRCLFTHFVKVFFWMASRSSENKNKEKKYKYMEFKEE